jgi:hypothetical protein
MRPPGSVNPITTSSPFSSRKYDSDTFILTKVKKALGVENLDVTAKFQNILVYEGGSFFKLHTDSEKEQGMFGTMAIQARSVFKGGAMKIQHNGETVAIDLAKHESCVTAWYADCPHELEPLTSGVRVVLVYNLIHASADKVSVERTSAADLTPFMNKTSPIIDAWRKSNEIIASYCAKEAASRTPEHYYRALVYKLDHKYTMNGLKKKQYFDWDVELRATRGIKIEGGSVKSDESSVESSEENITISEQQVNASGKEDPKIVEGCEPNDIQWEAALKGRDKNVVRALQQCSLNVTICVQDVIECISAEDNSETLAGWDCKIVRDGKLVDSEYAPRGYCGTTLFVFSKQISGWLHEQLKMGNLRKHYSCLDENKLVPSGNEGQDYYGWYRSAFLVAEPNDSELDKKRKAED